MSVCTASPTANRRILMNASSPMELKNGRQRLNAVTRPGVPAATQISNDMSSARSFPIAIAISSSPLRGNRCSLHAFAFQLLKLELAPGTPEITLLKHQHRTSTIAPGGIASRSPLATGNRCRDVSHPELRGRLRGTRNVGWNVQTVVLGVRVSRLSADQ
ncbi:hypothetical protein MKEN_01373800 [Mycena kentingensis (nom. inval.)]|nr:hypothetical protein MKEN_01373800 [Mycena kentingensis (nom. inval.)]